jgi:hypothetical protein
MHREERTTTMLHQVLMSLRSDYHRNAFYQVFKPGDTAFAFPLDGKEGWLTTTERETDIWLGADFPRVKVGFRGAASVQGEWIAWPMEVSVAKRIVLTKHGSIVEEDLEAGYDPNRLSEATFFTGDIFRALVSGLSAGVGAIPKVGAVLQFLVGKIWPEPSVETLLDAMERRMRWLIRASTRRLDLATQAAFLKTARENLDEFANSPGPRQRLTSMMTALSHFRSAKNFMTNPGKDYAPGTGHLVLQLAMLHLALLRERVVFEKEIFGDEAANSAANRQELKDTIGEYQGFLAGAIEKELAERDSQIELVFQSGIEITDVHRRVDLTNGVLTDAARRRIHRFSVEGIHNVLILKEPGKEADPIRFMEGIYRRQMANELKLQLRLDLDIPARLLEAFDPDREAGKILDYHEVIQAGPLSGIPSMRFLAPNMQGGTLQTHEPGRIRRIRVISMMGGVQLIPVLTVEGKDGKLRDSLEGVSPNSPFVVFDHRLPEDIFLSRVETAWDQHLRGLRLYFSDGDIRTLGDVYAKQLFKQSAALQGHYVSQIELDNGLMNVGFQLHPDFAERLG